MSDSMSSNSKRSPKFHTEFCNKPAKLYTPDLRTGRPLWEEEVNDLTGASVGWLSLFHLEGTEEFRVEFRDLAKRRAIDDAVDAKAEKAKVIAAEKLAASPHFVAMTIEVDGTSFEVRDLRWEDEEDRQISVTAHPHYAKQEDWIYDETDNKVGKFIIAGWKAMHPEKLAALAKTPEELQLRNRKWAQEDAEASAAEVAHSR